MDHNFTEKYRISARWTANTIDNLYGIAPGFPNFQEENPNVASHLTVGQTSTFKPNLINDFNLVRIANRLQNQFPGALTPQQTGINIPLLFPITPDTYPLGQLALTNIPQRIPGISLTNYASMAPGTPWANYETIYDFKDNLIWINGRHTIKTGFDIRSRGEIRTDGHGCMGRFHVQRRADRRLLRRHVARQSEPVHRI